MNASLIKITDRYIVYMIDSDYYVKFYRLSEIPDEFKLLKYFSELNT
jgi:hypothetical protein